MNEMILQIGSSPLFGLTITLLAFLGGSAIAKKIRNPIFHPLWISALMVIAVLFALKIPYSSYMEGGQYIHFLLQPATVMLALPLYRCVSLLMENFAAVICGIVLGVLTSFFSVWGLSMLFPLSPDLLISTFPKSITTPIALALSDTLGGVGALTATAVLLTGLLGSIIGPFLCRLCRIYDPVAVGVAFGTSCHAIGTSRAMELGEVEGAFAGLSIGVAGVTTVLVVPLLIRIFSVI